MEKVEKEIEGGNRGEVEEEEKKEAHIVQWIEKMNEWENGIT